eukprot:2743877-Heterocapsa_arctica.AAC.1
MTRSGRTPSRSSSNTILRCPPEQFCGFPAWGGTNGGEKSTVTEVGYLTEQKKPAELTDNREGKM